MDILETNGGGARQRREFFQLSDKEQAAALLKAAQRAAPQDSVVRAPGLPYAIGILGVDMVNQNGLRLHSPGRSKGAFAAHARAELETSTDLRGRHHGGYLGQYGLMMGAMFRERLLSTSPGRNSS
jgi:hypothetical protein